MSTRRAAAGIAPAPGGGRRRGRRRARRAQPASLPNIDLQKALEDVSSKLGDVDLRARRHGSVPRDRRVRRAGAAGRDGRDPRRGCRRAGRDVDRAHDRDRLGRRRSLGDTVSFLLGRRLGRGFVMRHGPRVRITHGALRPGRGLLLPPRRQDDPGRALHRAGAGAGAVHRRQLGDALLATTLPFSVLGTGLWAAAFALLGYFASQSLDAAAKRGRARARCSSGSRSS